MSDGQDDAKALLDTVVEVRQEMFPDLDARLVEEILEIQLRYAEDRAEARKKTDQAIGKWASGQSAQEVDG